MNIILLIGLMLLSSILASKILGALGFPAVTGYLVAGMIIGPSMLGIVGQKELSGLGCISEIALGLIAFHIGKSFEISKMKMLGKSIVITAVSQALLSVVLVLAFLTIYSGDLQFNIIIASIAAATAPAATLMVVKECKAKGILTDSLLTVVAVSDMICIILFSVCASIATWVPHPDAPIWSALMSPLIEIVGALSLGAFVGALTSKCIGSKNANDLISIAIPGIVIAVVGLSMEIGFSPLLSCLALGGAVVNLSKLPEKVFSIADFLSTPILVLFFAISGMHLDFKVLMLVGVSGILYIAARTIGKIGGSFFGATISGADTIVTRNLGFCLLPQAGVAIGLATVAADLFPEMASQILNLILGAVFVFEFIGPAITKKILMKCGECGALDTDQHKSNNIESIELQID
ncbi:MAG: cation:proton antiporter [Eubacteriales bacterium]